MNSENSINELNTEELFMHGANLPRATSYFFTVKQQSRHNFGQILQMQFGGKTVEDFKSEIFKLDHLISNKQNLSFRDLEVIYNKQILAETDPIDQCISTFENPLVIFVPTDLTMQEYKNFMTVSLSSIDAYKRQGLEN